MGVENLQYEDNPDQPQEQKKESNLDGRTLSKLSARERDRISRGTLLTEIRREADTAQKQAKDLLRIAISKKRLTSTEARKYEDQLKEAQTSGENSKDILEKLQRKLAEIDKSRLSDATTELDKNDPDLLEAYKRYDELIEENESVLGIKPTKEYKDWIRQQRPNLKTMEDLTVKFLRGELPPRVKTLEKLQATLGKYNVDPLSVKYLKEEGHSEKKEFLKNVETGEKHFQKMGGMKDQLYSQEAGKKLMQNLCKAENPQTQKEFLDQLAILSREESRGFTILKAAAQGNKISHKSMKNIMDYYKNLDSVEKRTENLKLWDSFVQAEARLTDNLQAVFNKEPANKEGFAIAFQMFKNMDFAEKEEFIKKQTKIREEMKSKEEENKNLTIAGFKHACTEASRKKTISASTEKNYHDWIDKNAEGKSYAEVKKFYDTLTSKTPNEQYKNLKAYEARREKFQDDIRKLREVNPTLTDEEVDEWQNKYDKEGWRKREEVSKELKAEIQKAQESRIGRVGKLNPKLLKKLKEGDESEESLSIQNKEAALAAIQDLIGLKAYGTAMKHCIKLLRINPEDEEVLSLMDQLTELADQGTMAVDQGKEDELYKQYAELAHQKIEHDEKTHDDTKEIQSQEIGLKLARQDQAKRKSLSAEDRNKQAVLEKIKGDEILTEMAEDYMEHAEDGKILNADTLGGQDVVEVDFQRVRSAEEKTHLRQQIYTEQVKADKHGGLNSGSTVIEFKDIHSNRVLDAREGQAADIAQKRDKENLAKDIAKKIAETTAVGGTDEDTNHLKLAREAALDEINKKADTRIETMTKAA